MSSEGGDSAWVEVGTIAAVLTLAVTIYLAIRESLSRRAQRIREVTAALDGLDREFRDLEVDADRAIQSVKHITPAVPGFRLRVEEIAAHLQAAREDFSAEQQTVVDYVVRQSSDANRAMDAAQEVPPGSLDRVRQYQLVALKAGHLFEKNEHGVTHIQRAQNAVAAARRRRRGTKS